MSLFFPNNRTYCDAASTTPVSKSVARAMKKNQLIFGNPSSIHAEGVKARALLNDARRRVAKAVGVRPHEIIFTASGTESNNIAILGSIRALIEKGCASDSLHIITSNLEHSSVLQPIKALESEGVKVTYLDGVPDGVIREQDIKNVLSDRTALVVLSYINSEIGTIPYVQKIGSFLRSVRTDRVQKGNDLPLIFHLDASQAPLYVPIDAERLYVDSMTLDGHKICGPKGIACLAVRERVALVPITYGGGQEKGIRSGTESLELIYGFAQALEDAHCLRESRVEKVGAVRDTLLRLVTTHIPDAIVNGSLIHRISNNLNISIPNIDPEFIVLKMDTRGVAISTKSSCLKGEEESKVVYSISKNKERARTTLRFSFLPSARNRDAVRVFQALRGALGR